MLNQNECEVLLSYYRSQVQELEDQLSVCNKQVGELQKDTLFQRSGGIPYTQMETFLSTLRENKKIEAIKMIRQFTSCGLKEAKDLFEALVPPGCNVHIH